ncbi:MAG: phytoene/squalene synthase family protein [Crocinitomicaceae bacterium]|nr:phytoene/squalene synthase family protein [Crocinitomicaceae bacterium]
MKAIFDDISKKSSKIVTNAYSTSFSLGIRFLDKELRNSIYAIYGFVRFADEIVDSFHDFKREDLLTRFRKDAFIAIEDGISLNPILNSFQLTVNKYGIPFGLIETFLDSMAMDISQKGHDQESYEKYILGSAEVVGLMCLKVFVNGDNQKYESLKPSAMKLGAAFQKINFLRDLNADFNGLGRVYFPNINVNRFSEQTKNRIEKEIESDFHEGYMGIKQLPKSSRFGVYVAYVYYARLLKKIKKTPANCVLEKRIRIPNERKLVLFLGSYIKHCLNLI